MGSVGGRLVEAAFSKWDEGEREGGLEVEGVDGWVGGCDRRERRRIASLEAFSRTSFLLRMS